MDDPLSPKLALLVLLLLVHALCTAAGAAAVSLNESKLARQAGEGDRTAARLLRLLQRSDGLLSAVQLAAALTCFFNAALTAPALARQLSGWLLTAWVGDALTPGAVRGLSLAVCVLALTALHLVLGELAPRRLAMQRAERTARAAACPLIVLTLALRPAVCLLDLLTAGILRLLRADPSAGADQVSEEEIRMMVDIGEEKGAIEAGEKEMIENIFEFNNMTAEDVMVHRTDMVMLWAGDSDAEIVKTIEESGLSRFPVYEADADDITGVLNTRDYLLNARRAAPKPLAELLRPAYFVPESVRTDVLFRDMQSRKTHLAIVVDEYGGTSGLVTMEDLLEEIVGNIYDEFDPQDEQQIVPLGAHTWRVAGSADLEEVAAALSVSLPEDEEADTLGGLVFAQLPVCVL